MREAGLSGDAKLVHMANQIARFFASQRHADPAEGVADHLRHFWEPRMRRAILAHVDGGGAGLDPVALAAVELLRAA
ncbi:MAG TPA: formate dehydrogenase subunit delta [Caulobacteraceae bacterium]|jgi:formate dehydrogenase subunit delta